MQQNKKKIIDSLKINSKDVGSSEVQIGLLSQKIKFVNKNNDIDGKRSACVGFLHVDRRRLKPSRRRLVLSY